MRTVWHLIDANVDTAFFRALAVHHDRARFRLAIGSLAPPGGLQAAMADLGIRSFALGVSRRDQYPAAVWRLARLLRANDVDIVHAHCFDPTLVGLAAARAASTAFVYTRHHSEHHIRLGKKWHIRLDGWAGRRADHVIAVSEATRRILRDIEGVPEDQLSVVHNGADAPRPVDDRVVTRLQEELNPTGLPVCTIVARLHEEKGHRFAVAAWPEVVRRCGPAMMLLAGEGPERAAIEAQIRALGVQEWVSVLGFRRDVPELMALSDVVILPSLAESFGFAALEAMSAGRPVVATSIGGLPEVVAHAETGLIVPPENAAAIADAVERLLEDRPYARRLGAAGPSRAAGFSAKRMVRGYERVYETVRPIDDPP